MASCLQFLKILKTYCNIFPGGRQNLSCRGVRVSAGPSVRHALLCNLPIE